MIDLDFPVGAKNKTATLITGTDDAILVDAGFTRADGHRLVAAILDSGKTLRTVVVSHADPDFYWGIEVVADADRDHQVVRTELRAGAAIRAMLADGLTLADIGVQLLGLAQEIGSDQGLGGLSVGDGDDPAPPAVRRLPPPGQQSRHLACPVLDPHMDTDRLRPVSHRAAGRGAGWPFRPVSERAELRSRPRTR